MPVSFLFSRSKFSSCLKHQNKMSNLYSHETISEHFRRFSTGVEYDLDQQCSFAFGEPAEYCYSKIDVCVQVDHNMQYFKYNHLNNFNIIILNIFYILKIKFVLYYNTFI